MSLMSAESTEVELELQAQGHLARLIERLAADESALSMPHEALEEASLAVGRAAVAAALAAARRLEAQLQSAAPPDRTQAH
jgi:hypothetical protein